MISRQGLVNVTGFLNSLQVLCYQESGCESTDAAMVGSICHPIPEPDADLEFF